LLLFSVVDFSVLVLLLESGELLLVWVVVVDWDDFSDVSGEAAAPGAPSEPVAPVAPLAPGAPAGPWLVAPVAPVAPGAPAGPWLGVVSTVSLHPTPTALKVPSKNAIAAYVAAFLRFFCMISS
jgi:hypothetical protein